MDFDTPLTVYLDGGIDDNVFPYLQDTRTHSESPTEMFGQFAIGSRTIDDLGYSPGADFLVDEMLMWDEALNETQVQALFWLIQLINWVLWMILSI